MPPDFSPLSDAFSNIADEDTWLKMNKGYVADLDSLQMTPARKVQSFPFDERTPGLSNEGHNKQELQNLESKLERAIMEKNELEKMHEEQVLLNNKLVGEILELQQEAKVIREFPQKLSNSLEICKDIFLDGLSSPQTNTSGEKSSITKLLSSTSEIGKCLFTTLEAHLTMDVSLIQEQHELLRARLNSIMESLVLSETSIITSEQVVDPSDTHLDKGCAGDDCWTGSLNTELDDIKEICQGMEKELISNNQLLESSKQQYNSLEREFKVMKEERDSLHKIVSESVKKLELETKQKETALKELNAQIQRRRDLEEGIKNFSVAFASRHRSFMSFNSDLKSKTEELRNQNPVGVAIPKSLGC